VYQWRYIGVFVSILCWKFDKRAVVQTATPRVAGPLCQSSLWYKAVFILVTEYAEITQRTTEFLKGLMVGCTVSIRDFADWNAVFYSPLSH
jgi:hypothetical protein